MKRILIVLAVLFGANLAAQPLNYSELLPENKEVKKGVLPNGLTYYIYPTEVVKGVASYYMIQNVGSILENEDQMGLAHFLEHMAFNGTENFPDKELLSTLQKHGAVFGRDVNAYTAFDETVYNMNNIPTTPELIDTGLLVLRDWSNYLTLDNEEIDLERGVIKEEWRTRQNGSMRILEKNLPIMFNKSLYAERLPIGTMEVVENFEYDALKQFYHDWYRTDLQAIAIIGDVDVSTIENKIKNLFSSIPAVENPKERFIVDIPGNSGLIYGMAMDDEVSTASISFGIRHPKSLAYGTVSDLKESLLNNMVTMMLSDRLREISDDPNAPFFRAIVSYNNHSRSSRAFMLSISPKVGKQQDAFESTLKEINRAVKFGFTKGEVDRAITNYKNSYENQISRIESRPHSAIQSMIQNNYLENSRMTDLVQEYGIVSKIFDGLSEEEVHARLKDLYTEDNRFVLVTGVNDQENLSENEALQIIKSIETDKTLVAYQDEFSGKTLLGDLKVKEGKIKSEKKNNAIGSTTFTMSNGIKVHYKFADKNKNDVRLSALSYGGLSLLDDADLPSAAYTAGLVDGSGLGDYSNSDLDKVLAGKTASTRVSISGISESIAGASSTRDVETMLQMVHLRFVKPRFDEDVYKVLVGNLENHLISRSRSLNDKINDSIQVTLYGKNNPKQALFTQDHIDKVSFERMQNIYTERFDNAADFEFFIVGDVSEDQLKPLLEKYIASIPTNKQRENYKNNTVEWLDDAIEKDVFLAMENPKSTVRVFYKNELKYTPKNALLARALGDILQLRYTETLREQEGGTYGASASVSLSKRPIEEVFLSIGFDCNPAMVDRLVAIVHEELNGVASGNISQSDLDKSITSYLKGHEEAKEFNQFDMQLLTNFYREDFNMNDPANFEDIAKNITVSDVQEFAKKMLKGAKTSQIIIKPSI